MTGCTVRRYEQLETSPEIEQELPPAVCEHDATYLRRIIVYSVDLLNLKVRFALSEIISSHYALMAILL